MNNKDTNMTRPFPEENQNVVYGLAIDKLHLQQQQIDALESKIGNLLGFSSALLAILAGFIALMLSEDKTIPGFTIAMLSVAGGAYLIIVIGSLFTYYIWQWEVGPILKEVWQYAREYKEIKMVFWAAESFTLSYANNMPKVNKKIWVVKINLLLVALQTIAIVAGFIYTIIG